MDTYDKVRLGVLSGFVAGALLGGKVSWGVANQDNAQIYNHDNSRQIIRTHEFMRGDQVYINESNTNGNSYISVKKYLEEIKNKQDQTIQKAKIEKLVGTW